MGAKIGCVILASDRTDLLEDLVAIAQQECCAVSVDVADLYVATALNIAPYFAAAPERHIAVLGLRAERVGPGADAIAQAVVERLGIPAMTAFVNDFYSSGGYQIWGPVRSSMLIDFEVSIGGTRVSYVDAPRLGVAQLLGIDPEPAPAHRLQFLEALCSDASDAIDLRIVAGGVPLRPPYEHSADGEAALEWDWLSERMVWPMMEGAARRELRHRRSAN